MSKLRSYANIACLLLSLLGFNNLQAQVLYNNGAQLYTSGAAVLWVGGTAQNANAGNFTNEGQTTITANYINDATTQGNGEYLVAGNWVNNATFLEGLSQVRLNGAAQLITGSQITTFYILDLLGTGIKTQTIDANINNAGTLFLNDRELATDVNTMFVLNPALNAVQRTSGFVSSLDMGRLSRVTNQNGIYLFPTGSSVGTLRYRPLELTPLAATSNTYAARLANYDADVDGYDRTMTNTDVCEVNPLFFHVVNRTLGTENADLRVYYDQSADGLWTSVAQWNVTPVQWEDMAPVTAGVNTLDFIDRAAWNDWSDEPYALTTTAPFLTVTDPSPVCAPNTVDITLAAVTAGSDAGTLTYYADSLDAVAEINPITNANALNTSGRYYISLNNGVCNVVAGVQVTINPLDDDGFTYSNDTLCLGVGTEIPTINVPGGNFTFSPVGLTINASTGEVDLVASSAGNYNITYTTTGACPNDSIFNLVLQDPSDASFTYDLAAYCEGALVNPTLTVTGTTGVFSATPAGLTLDAAGNVDLTTSAPGVYTVRNDIAASGTCPAVFHTESLTVTAQDSPSYSYTSNTLCLGAGSATATITGTAGGNFTFTPAGLVINGADGTIDLATSAANTYAITYTTTGTCPADTTINVTLTNSPDATFSYDALSYCEEATVNPVLTVSGSTGVFSATPIGLSINTAGAVDISLSAPGVYTVRNEIAASGSCPLTFHEESLTITAQDDAGFTYASDSICLGAGTASPTVNALGGTFTFTPVGLIIDNSTGDVDLVSSSAGDYAITYTTSGTCISDSTFNLVLRDPSDATFAYDALDYCEGASINPVINITGTAGSFTVTPAGLGLNATTGAVDLSTSSVNNYTVRNEIAAIGGCPLAFHEETLNVNAIPAFTSVTDTVKLCSGTTDITGEAAGTGSLSFHNTLNDAQNGSNALASPNAVGVGKYYVRLENNGCYSVDSVVVDDAAFTVALASDATNDEACINSDVLITATTTNAAGPLVFTYEGVAQGNNATYTVNEATASSYTYNVSVQDANNCIATNSININFIDGGVVDMVSSMTNTCEGNVITIYTNASAPFAWSTGETTSSITLSNVGVYNLTLTAGACNGSVTNTFEIFANPTVSIVASNPNPCLGEDVNLTTNPSAFNGYNWSTGEITAGITVQTDGAYTVDVSDANGCTANASINLTFSDFTLSLPDSLKPCYGSLATIDAGSGASSYSWNTGETGAVITAATDGLYIVTAGSGACLKEDTTVVMFVNGFSTLADITDESCLGANDGTVTLTTPGANMPVNMDWSNGNTGDYGDLLMPGDYYILLQDAVGCTDSINVTVNPADTACLEVNPHYYIPNSFSPDGDGMNDILFVRGEGIESLTFIVYDRWGELIFETSTLEQGWDGTYKGVDLDPAVFAYYVKIVFVDGERVKEYGDISLIR